MMMRTNNKASTVTAAALFVLAATAGTVRATKDDLYYRAGMGNPNVDLKMYWADAHNVLEDLDQFSALYIQYHNCAWSQNRLYYNDGEGGSADESDYWYIGATPDFAANVAYSLYGVLKGESAPSSSPCGASTFINSFTTSAGFEVFAAALYTAGMTGTDYSQVYSSKCGGGKGVACDYNFGFASVTYSTSTCDPKYASATTDSMTYMNAAFHKAQCVKIYTGSNSYSSNYYNNNNYNNYNNNGGGRDLQRAQELEMQDAGMHGLEIEPLEIVPLEGGGQNDADSAVDRELNGNNNYGYGYNNYYYAYSGTPLALLYYSNACFIQNFWAPNGGCPDPYGRLQYYQQNFNRGVRHSLKVDPYVKYRANMEKGKKLVTTGAFLFMGAFLLYLVEQLIAFRKRVRALQHQEAIARAADPTIPPAAPSKVVRARSSVVGLVQSATGKLAGAVAGAVAAARSRSRNDLSDSIMKTDGSTKDVNDEAAGSYSAPEAGNSFLNMSFTGSLTSRPATQESVASASAGDTPAVVVIATPTRSGGDGLPPRSPKFIDVGAVPSVDLGGNEALTNGTDGGTEDGTNDDNDDVPGVEILRRKASGVRGLFGKMKSKVVP
jgi:hypothetical protein